MISALEIEPEEEEETRSTTFITDHTSGGTVYNINRDYIAHINFNLMPGCAPPEAMNQIFKHMHAASNTPSLRVAQLPRPSEPPSDQLTRIFVAVDPAIRSIDQVHVMISIVQTMMANPMLCSSKDLPETLASLKRLLTLMELALRAYQHTDLAHSLSSAISIGVEECRRLLDELIINLTKFRHVLSNAVLYFIRKYMWARIGWQGSAISTLDSKLRKSHSSFAACLLALGRAAWPELKRGLGQETLDELAKFYVQLEQESTSLRHIEVDTVIVQDHLGRNLHVPMIFCTSSQDFHVVITGFCRGLAGDALIRRGHYRILNSKDNQVINPEQFSIVLKPGMAVDMSIVFHEQAKERQGSERYSCPRCKHINSQCTGWVICANCNGSFNISPEEGSIVSPEVEQHTGIDSIPDERYLFRKILIFQAGSGANSPTAAAKYMEYEETWAPRPTLEEIYARLEEFFPEHDIDKPILEAGSSTAAEQYIDYEETRAPRPAPEEIYARLEKSFPAHDIDKPVFEAGSGAGSSTATESIRIVAGEHKKRFNRTSLAENIASVPRKRSTKLWGSRMEEVIVGHASLPGLPSGGAGPIFKWVRGELIGRGTHSRVYLALNATTGEMIVVKQVEMSRTILNEKAYAWQAVLALRSETDTLKDLDHPNVVQFLGFEETPNFFSLFLEYIPGGSLGSCLRKHGKFEEDVTKSFTEQILTGLEYLHSKNILHRGLKADNILVETSGVCKIDFGISERISGIDGVGESTAIQPGSVFWMAPEVINDPTRKGYDKKIDIWSVGCVVLEMWTGKRPWSGNEAMTVISKLHQTKLPPPVSDDVTMTPLAHNFKNLCFAINPDERPTAAKLRQHPYLALPYGWYFTGFRPGV